MFKHLHLNRGLSENDLQSLESEAASTRAQGKGIIFNQKIKVVGECQHFGNILTLGDGVERLFFWARHEILFIQHRMSEPPI